MSLSQNPRSATVRKSAPKSGQKSAPEPAPDEQGAHPPTLSRRERRAAETRIRLFRSALQLFAERGFPNVTVEDITQAADVGKGTFFNYFESKDHVLGVMAEIQLSKVKEAALLAGQGKQTISSIVHRMFLGLAEEPGRSPDLARALIASFLANEGVRTVIKRHMADGRSKLGEVIAIGQQRGEVNKQLQKETVATQMLQTVMGTVLLWSLHGEPPLQTWIEDSFQHFWRAVAAPGQE